MKEDAGVGQLLRVFVEDIKSQKGWWIIKVCTVGTWLRAPPGSTYISRAVERDHAGVRRTHW
jgi:hypothetical protein